MGTNLNLNSTILQYGGKRANFKLNFIFYFCAKLILMLPFSKWHKRASFKLNLNLKCNILQCGYRRATFKLKFIRLVFLKIFGRSGKIPDSKLKDSRFELCGFNHLFFKGFYPTFKESKDTKFTKIYNVRYLLFQ